jgi:CHASE2 domain-containing sensor protein
MKALRRLFQEWRKLPRFWRRLAWSLFIGLAIEGLLQLMSGAGWRRDLENASIDGLMRFASQTNISWQREARAAFTFIDIDEASYAAWQEPLFTPRDELLQLIQFAARQRPRLVVVDVELARTTGAKNQPSDEDTRLASYLLNYPASAKTDSDGNKPEEWPPILLARSFRQPRDASTAGCLEARPSFVDEKTKLPASVRWASVKFGQEDDGVIRHWRLWERLCGGSEPQFLPSVELQAASILRDRANGELNLEKGFREFAKDCGDCGEAEPASEECSSSRYEGPALQIGNWKIQAGRSRISQRVLFSIPWKREGDRTGWPVVRVTGGAAEGTPILYRIPAISITKPGPGGQPPEDAFKDRVVVIGGSFADSGDIHATPLGEMPGSLILINAISSLGENGQLRPPPCWSKYALLVILIVMMSAIFTEWPRFWAMLICAGIIIGGLLPVSFYAFRRGWWIDFAIPLVAVLLHNLAAEFEGARGDRGDG